MVSFKDGLEIINTSIDKNRSTLSRRVNIKVFYLVVSDSLFNCI